MSIPQPTAEDMAVNLADSYPMSWPIEAASDVCDIAIRRAVAAEAALARARELLERAVRFLDLDECEPTADEMRRVYEDSLIDRQAFAVFSLFARDHFPALIAMRVRVDELEADASKAVKLISEVDERCIGLESDLAAATVHRCELERQLSLAKAEIERLNKELEEWNEVQT